MHRLAETWADASDAHRLERLMAFAETLQLVVWAEREIG